MHFHCLFLLNLLICPENYAYGKEESCARCITDCPEEVCPSGQKAHEGSGEERYRGYVPLQYALYDLGVVSESGDLHARAFDLLGDILRTHVCGFDPELGEYHASQCHERDVGQDVYHHLAQAMAVCVSRLIQ